MTSTNLLILAFTLLPPVLMLAAMPHRHDAAWQRYRWLSVLALFGTAVSLALQIAAPAGAAGGMRPWLDATRAGAWIGLLVQLLGTTIGFFSSRYLEGEPGQPRYVAALAGVLAAVHLLLLADHWLVLIVAWAAVGVALRHLLCFYGDRPFALLAAHKKRVADRIADALLIAAAALAWNDVGSGALSALLDHVKSEPLSPALQASAVCLALAVLLRSASMPVHGWLIQVMEAPTPVSALLHAGVVNLGGFVLVRFAPLLEAAPAARWLLVGVGLATAVLAGLVMLTRISIKVRLAWSTVAQMGFMVMECGLGLYTLALLHLLGHSVYKAHAFLASSSAVEETRLRMMHGAFKPAVASLVWAPVLSAAVVALTLTLTAARAPVHAWPWWWSAVLALAWAPLLWQPSAPRPDAPGLMHGTLTGVAMVAALVLAAIVGHALPLGVHDAPDDAAGVVVLLGMALLHLCVVAMHARPGALSNWRRWSYAGFYLDEFVTRAALNWWPARWTPAASK